MYAIIAVLKNLPYTFWKIRNGYVKDVTGDSQITGADALSQCVGTGYNYARPDYPNSAGWTYYGDPLTPEEGELDPDDSDPFSPFSPSGGGEPIPEFSLTGILAMLVLIGIGGVFVYKKRGYVSG